MDTGAAGSGMATSDAHPFVAWFTYSTLNITTHTHTTHMHAHASVGYCVPEGPRVLNSHIEFNWDDKLDCFVL